MLIGYSKLLIDVNVSVNGCLSLSVHFMHLSNWVTVGFLQ